MESTRNRRHLALVGILALALSLTVGLAVSNMAAAKAHTAKHKKKKKKKNPNPGGTIDVSKSVNAQIPDATITPPSTLKNGILTSTIDVPATKPFVGTLIRDVNVTLKTTGDTQASGTPAIGGSASQLEFRLTAPDGTTSWLFGDEAGSPVSGASLSSLTIDDDTPVQLTSGAPRDNTQLGPPYNGSAQPDPFTSYGPAALWIMDGGPATGTWTLRAYDHGAATGSNPAVTSVLNSWRITVVAGRPFRLKP